MKALFQEATLILVIGALLSIGYAKSISNNTVKTVDYLYEDYDDDIDHEEILFNEDKPCPRDCICTASFTVRLARCSRLEIGTQKFGDDITDLVVEDVDSKHPIVLTDMMFKKLGLQQVANIKIANSLITSISPTAFKGLHELSTVNLTANNINRIHPETFAYNSKLSLLTLSDNPLTLTKGDWNPYFLNSSSIQEIVISRCNIKSLPKTTFSKMTNLLYINMAENKLHKIEVGVFSDLQDLEEVDLSHNFLKTVPEKLFSANSELATLRLGNNPISTVINVQIKELLTLDLGMANIETIGPSMFNGMQFISNLNLSGNGIITIHNQAFHRLVELNYLDLSNNKLNLISDQLIKENIELDVLKIGNNPHLKSLPSKGFACSAEQFNIYLFDASGCSLETIPSEFFKSMPVLSQLDLSSNKLTSLGSALQATTGLVELDLSYNMIISLDKNTFALNKDLGKLNLAGNPLTSLSPDLFLGATQLTWMDVSSCKLAKLWNNEEEKLPRDFLNNLHYLNISNNQIQSLHVIELEMINKLFTLDISQNPLRCDNDFESLMTWLGKHNVSPATTDMHRANLEMMAKKQDNRYKWEFMAKQTCSKKVDDEEKNALKDLERETLSEEEDEDADSDDESDDIDDSAVVISLGDANHQITLEKLNRDEISHLGLPIKNDEYKKIIDQINKENEMDELLTKAKNDIKHNLLDNRKPIDIDETVGIMEKAMDDDIDTQYVYYKADSSGIFDLETVYGVWKILRFVILFVIFIFAISRIVRLCRIHRENKHTIIVDVISKPSQGKVKKDCGLVYQQLSEDLTGPKTPIVSRHESKSKIPPECV